MKTLMSIFFFHWSSNFTPEVFFYSINFLIYLEFRHFFVDNERPRRLHKRLLKRGSPSSLNIFCIKTKLTNIYTFHVWGQWSQIVVDFYGIEIFQFITTGLNCSQMWRSKLFRSKQIYHLHMSCVNVFHLLNPANKWNEMKFNRFC